MSIEGHEPSTINLPLSHAEVMHLDAYLQDTLQLIDEDEYETGYLLVMQRVIGRVHALAGMLGERADG